MTPKLLKACVIGLRHGHIAEFARAAVETAGVQLVGIAEDVTRLAEAARERWGVPVYSDYREMLDREKPDVVGLAVTNANKAGVAVACMSRGIHVIADKPLLTTPEDLERVRDAVASGRAHLSLMLTCRFGAGYRKIGALIREGQLGQVVHVATFGPHRLRPAGREPWMLNDAESGGVLVDIGIHYLDLLRWYIGEEPLRVSATHGNMRFPELPEFTDHGHALLTFPGGAVGYVSVDWLTPEASPVNGDYRVFVTGTRGYCELKSGAPASLTLVTDTLEQQQVSLEAAETTPSRDFLEALRDGRMPHLAVEDVLGSTALTLAAREAAQTGRPVELVRPRN
jgi:predicted dehydrogenase